MEEVNRMGLIVAVVLAVVVFWLVAHISILLAVLAGLLVLLAGWGGPRYYGRGRGL
jgi:hypothetical protein